MSIEKLKLSKTTLSYAERRGMAVDASFYRKQKDIDELGYFGDLTIWLDDESVHDGDIVFKAVNYYGGDYTYELWNVFSKDLIDSTLIPNKKYAGEKGIRQILNLLKQFKITEFGNG